VAIVVASIVGEPWPGSVRDVLRLVGLALVVAGGALVLLSVLTLGRSLTPFPSPLERGRLVERGPYRLVRHPLYAGGILLLSGISLVYSPWALLFTAVLAVVWCLKVRVEERFLTERFPGYAEYAARTRFRLIPFVY
jgi:protein-S-isoprenylcysteine O-methyltransferase Ste14